MWFRAMLLDDRRDDPSFQNFWAEAPRLGDALEEILRAARALGLDTPRVVHADPVSSFPEVELSGHGALRWDPTRFTFDASEVQPFTLPAGVVLSADGDDVELRAGYFQVEDAPVWRVECAVSAERLIADHVHLLRTFEPYKVFWVELQDDWEDAGERELFVNRSLDQADAIVGYLEANAEDSWTNGHVTLTAFADEGSTNVSLTDHKTLRVTTTDTTMAERARDAFRLLGYRRDDDLPMVSAGVHHWHYRPGASRGRADAIERLVAQGFTRWTPG